MHMMYKTLIVTSVVTLVHRCLSLAVLTLNQTSSTLQLAMTNNFTLATTNNHRTEPSSPQAHIRRESNVVNDEYDDRIELSTPTEFCDRLAQSYSLTNQIHRNIFTLITAFQPILITRIDVEDPSRQPATVNDISSSHASNSTMTTERRSLPQNADPIPPDPVVAIEAHDLTHHLTEIIVHRAFDTAIRLAYTLENILGTIIQDRRGQMTDDEIKRLMGLPYQRCSPPPAMPQQQPMAALLRDSERPALLRNGNYVQDTSSRTAPHDKYIAYIGSLNDDMVEVRTEVAGNDAYIDSTDDIDGSYPDDF